MYIDINEHKYILSQDAEKGLTNLVAETIEGFLVKMPTAYKTIGEQVARKMLYDKEKEAIKLGYDKEAAALLRPGKNESPIHKLMNIALNEGVHDAMSKFTLVLSTNETEVIKVSYE